MAEQQQYRGTVLVIDDERVTRLTVAKILAKESFHVLQAENGDDGIALAREHKPDIILLDVIMPGIDGYETCKRIRRFSSPNSLPIIMLTGLNDVRSVDASFDAGATDFISKPINWSILGQRVKYALRSKLLNTEILNNQKRLQQAQKIARLGYWEARNSFDSITCSKELLNILRLGNGLESRSLDDLLALVNPDDIDRVRDTLLRVFSSGISAQFEHRIQRRDGKLIHVNHRIEAIHNDSNDTRIMGIIQDISESKEAEAIIEYQRHFDALTGLPNKSSLLDKLGERVNESVANNTNFGILLLSVDRYETLTNTLGHTIGDALIKLVAERLQHYENSGYYVARYRDDVFAILTPNLSNIDDSATLAKRLIHDCSKAYTIKSQELHTDINVGISICPIDSDDADTIIKGADAARLRAKKDATHNFHLFSEKLNQVAQERLALEREMRAGLQNGEFEVYYQPQVDTASGMVIGMEALVRWNHPGKGLVSPLHFIPVAEESGMINELGRQVLLAACHQTSEWRKRGLGKLRVGVNLSARQLAGGDYFHEVKNILRETGLDPAQLDLEITESMAVDNIDAVMHTITDLKKLGIAISMDDFGTGYSALAYLQKLPLDILKIDRSFVKNIGQGDNGAIARAIVAMAHSMGLHVIAEGVETVEQYDVIRRTGCNEIQGYYFSPPVSADKFEKYVLRHNGTTRDNSKAG